MLETFFYFQQCVYTIYDIFLFKHALVAIRETDYFGTDSLRIWAGSDHLTTMILVDSNG